MTIKDLLTNTSKQIDKVSGTPDLDVAWLLLEVLGKEDTSYLIAHGEDEVSPAQKKRFLGMIERRAKGEPLAYILGWWEFYGRSFKVTPDVLVPRPATEELVDKALEKIFSLNKLFGRPITVADIGTGSGVLAITLILELGTPSNSPSERGRNNETAVYKILATDILGAALIVAKENALKYGVADKIEWRQGDMLEAIKNERIDLIVSNPPYVPTEEINRVLLSPTPATAGLAFEPRAALDGGTDGLKYVKQIQEAGIPYVIESVGGKILEG